MCHFHPAYLLNRASILGIYKVKTLEDGNVTSDTPQFQMFQCRHAPTASSPEADAGGRTLFANTYMIYQQLIENDITAYASEVKTRKFSAFTPANALFGGHRVELPLVMKNPINGRSVVRWHERWCVILYTLGVENF